MRECSGVVGDLTCEEPGSSPSPNSWRVGSQGDRRTQEQFGRVFVEMFYEGNMEGVKNPARSCVTKPVNLRMGGISNQDTRARTGKDLGV